MTSPTHTLPGAAAAIPVWVRRPELWVWGVAGAAWLVMLRWHPMPAPQLGAHQHHGGGTVTAPHPQLLAGGSLWVLMVLAMMTPTVAPVLHVVAHRSLRRRRVRSMMLFLTGYLTVWILAGFVVVGVLSIASPQQTALRWVTVVVLLLAAGYEVTGWKWRALMSCHLLPSLPARGVPADMASARAGWRNGTFCLASCWALMLVVVVDGHRSWALLVLVTALVWGQRLLTSRRRRVPPAAVCLGLAALLLTVTALLSTTGFGGS